MQLVKLTRRVFHLFILLFSWPPAYVLDASVATLGSLDCLFVLGCIAGRAFLLLSSLVKAIFFLIGPLVPLVPRGPGFLLGLITSRFPLPRHLRRRSPVNAGKPSHVA